MSKRLKGLREKKVEIFEKAEALIAKVETEKRDFTAEERTLNDGYRATLKAIDADIDAEHEMELQRAKMATPVVLESTEGFSIPRQHALKHFKGEKPTERAHRFGQFMLASVFGNVKAHEWCMKNGVVLRAQSEGVNTAGGFLVPEEIAMDIIVLRDEYGLARRKLQVMPMGRDTITVPRLASGLTAYFVGEGATITASQAAWNQVRLTAKKLGALTILSSELDEDAAVNVGDILVGEMAYAFANKEDTVLFSGTGISTDGGITGLRTIFNAGVGSLIGAVDAGSGLDTMAEITAADLARAQGALPQYVYTRGNPTWYCSQTMWANVFERLIGASGGVTKDQASGRTIREYNGYPVELTQAMLAPAAATTNCDDVAMILFGDLAMAASMGDRRGITVARSTEYKFAEDQVAIKATERFDINVHDTGDTVTAGPIVALMGE
jgi:HK97 family phage major capsid protein